MAEGVVYSKYLHSLLSPLLYSRITLARRGLHCDEGCVTMVRCSGGHIQLVYLLPLTASSLTVSNWRGAPPILYTVSRMNCSVRWSSSMARVTPAWSNRYCHSGVKWSI